MSQTTDEMTANDAAPDIHQCAAELCELGWRETKPDYGPLDFLMQTPRGGIAIAGRCFESAAGTRLLVLRMPELNQPPGEELFKRFLDFSLETRMLFEISRRMQPCDWLLVVLDDQALLYRAPLETIELQAEWPWDWRTSLMPFMAGLLKTPEGRGGSAQSAGGAESLRDWLKHWSSSLGSILEVRPENISNLIWKLIIARQASVRSRRGPGTYWGVTIDKIGSRWEVMHDALSAPEDLRREIESFEQRFETQLLGLNSDQECWWLERLEEGNDLERFRAELLMQSQARFEPESVLWLFSDMNREARGWQQTLAGRPPVRKLIRHEGWNVFEPYECDVATYGISTAINDFERVARYWYQLDLYQRDHPAIGGDGKTELWGQPDLFCGIPTGVNERGVLQDGMNFIFAESFRIREHDSDRKKGTGIVLILKALALAPHLGWSARPLTHIDHLFLNAE